MGYEENFSEFKNIKNGQEKLSPLDTRQKDAIFMFKAMYQPVMGQYVAFGLDIEQSAIESLNTYGLDAIKSVYQHKTENNQLGMLKAWSVSTFGHEFRKLTNPPTKIESEDVKSQFSDIEQGARWLAIIYEENNPGTWVFDKPIDDKYFEASETLIKNYTLMAIRNLLDYTIHHGNGGRYGSNKNVREIAADVIRANQWRNISNPK